MKFILISILFIFTAPCYAKLSCRYLLNIKRAVNSIEGLAEDELPLLRVNIFIKDGLAKLGLMDDMVDVDFFAAPRGPVEDKVFLRDFSPLYQREELDIVAINYINLRYRNGYYTEHQKREVMFSYRTPDQPTVTSRNLPLILEGASLIRTKDQLFVSEKVYQINRWEKEDHAMFLNRGEHLENYRYYSRKIRNVVDNAWNSGYRPRDKNEINRLLAENFRLDPSQITEVSWLPGETTGHLDTILSYVSRGSNKGTFFVKSIPDWIFNSLEYNHESWYASEIAKRLDGVANQISGMGYNVIRIPSLPPRNLTRDSISPLGWKADYIPSINWIIKENQIIIPEFKFHNSNVVEKMKNDIKGKLEALGFEAKFLFVDDINRYPFKNGWLHCGSANCVDF